jgi:rhamnosyltransferase
MSIPNILINIVLYYHDKNKVLELLNVCTQYAEAKILLFNNGESFDASALINMRQVVFFQSSKNVGVAGAHHYACQMAEAENFDFVLFLDQDSQLPHHFIQNMIFGFYQLQKRYSRLVAIGPSWRDPRLFDCRQEKRLKNKLKTKLKSKLRDKLKLNHIIISSGMLIWVPSLKTIGYPKKEYFIDLVDTEWCLRALCKNYQIIILENLRMQHTIGEVKKTKNSLLQYQHPIRYYYMLRNSFFLFNEKHIPWLLRFYFLLRNIAEIKKIPFVPKSRASFLAAVRGIKDGLLLKNKCQ